MDLLVVGGSGFLGRELVRLGLQQGRTVAATYLTSPGGAAARWHRLDITDRGEVAALLASVRPSLVVNAAYRQSDWSTTADGAMHVAAAAREVGARLVHVSSEAIFSGLAGPYDETAKPDPVSAYGAAKAAAEVAVAGLDPASVIARTSLIVGRHESMTERFVHGLADGSRSGVLFTDELRCAVHVTDLATALLELGDQDASGVHHLAGTDAVSRHELGVLIARRDGLDETKLPTGLRADTAVPGPIDVRLDSTATQARLDVRLRGAREFLTGGAVEGFSSSGTN
ncbi:SDR family oxidoreductase [Kineosporia succinea]|uniref:dTDP-4-dehydrorhamnose reductase n=1 Tax=Kineosporia succinea TaxID=84632 RepID=A0ABT9PBM9_9ACTN|nr:sugar nucleotide-binding protein [Kineosporia succinea]MDP9830109.1 dTDP-4-dehydrorhamnose reductase [Kineosporia succinea]